jgi:hypothetical protein
MGWKIWSGLLARTRVSGGFEMLDIPAHLYSRAKNRRGQQAILCIPTTILQLIQCRPRPRSIRIDVYARSAGSFAMHIRSIEISVVQKRGPGFQRRASPQHIYALCMSLTPIRKSYRLSALVHARRCSEHPGFRTHPRSRLVEDACQIYHGGTREGEAW